MKHLWDVSTTEYAGGKEGIMRRGNVYQIANGYMGYRGTLDEFGPEEAVGVTIAGIFDRVGSAWREPVNAPNAGYTRVTLDGVELSALGRKVTHHEQRLNFTNAIFERETIFSSRGKKLTLKSARFLSADTPHLGVVKLSVHCDKAANVTIRTGIDCNIWDLNGPHLLQLAAEKHDSVLLVQGITSEAAKRVVVAEAVALAFGTEAHESTDNRNLRVINLRAEAGRTYTFYKYFAVFTENDAAGKTSPSLRSKPSSERVRSAIKRVLQVTMRSGAANGFGATYGSRAMPRRSTRFVTVSFNC